MTRRPLLRLAGAALVSATAVVSLRAASPTFWQVSTQIEFLKGDAVENISIDSDGRIVLGPLNAMVHEATAPFLWSAFEAADGAVIAGTGNDGRVLRVGTDGKGQVLFDAPELEAHAVAPGPGGTVYAATSPDGKIYRVEKDGKTQELFDPTDKYLWALAVAADGTLYAGAGDKGVVYRISSDGTATTFLKTSASHVTALAFDARGNLLVGTESPGQVLRVSSDGRAFVLLDSTYREVRRLRFDGQGRVYAVAVSGKPPADPRPAERPAPEPSTTAGATPMVSTEITINAIGDVPVPSTTSTAPRTDTRKEKQGAVYRILPDGLWDVVWESSDDSPYDVAFDRDGSLLVGTGNKGKIFRVAGEPVRTTLVVRAAAQQVSSFVSGASGELLYITSNPGKVYRLSVSPATRGVYESEVRDATTVATWGALRWRGTLPPGCAIEISTRSGNTGKPDETWSDWSPPYTEAEGSLITSPRARYLQWRAVLTGTKGASPVLTSVTAAYLPRNTRPAVESITVHPPGVVFQRPFSTGEAELAGYEAGTSDGRPLSPSTSATLGLPSPALGRRTYQKGLQTFVWKATDADEDRLQYDVFQRREGSPTWVALRKGLWDPILTWDTSSLPDGTYTIKVVASDTPTNAPESALVGELESVSFDVDNTPPVIELGTPRAADRLTFSVRDGQSPILRVEYSDDASRWRMAYPADGLSDSRRETFDVPLDGAASPGSVIIRATDALNNVATAVVERK